MILSFLPCYVYALCEIRVARISPLSRVIDISANSVSPSYDHTVLLHMNRQAIIVITLAMLYSCTSVKWSVTLKGWRTWSIRKNRFQECDLISFVTLSEVKINSSAGSLQHRKMLCNCYRDVVSFGYHYTVPISILMYAYTAIRIRKPENTKEWKWYAVQITRSIVLNWPKSCAMDSMRTKCGWFVVRRV